MKVQKPYSLALLLTLLIPSLLFAEPNQDTPGGETQAVELRSGMTKEELYRMFPKSRQKHYHKLGGLEYIVFDDIRSESEAESILFCLQGGRVLWWDAESMDNKTPEERLELLKRRNSLSEDIKFDFKRQEQEAIKKSQAERKGRSGSAPGSRSGPYYKRGQDRVR